MSFSILKLELVFGRHKQARADWQIVIGDLAESLNLPLERVRAGQQIADSDAERIRQRYPQLINAELIGRAYDSVFKELCSSGQLRVEDEVVLTPFPFVSAIAGVLLYFDLLKSLRPSTFQEYRKYNYLRLNPLYQPNPSYRVLRASRSDCPVCKNPAVQARFSSAYGEPRISGGFCS